MVKTPPPRIPTSGAKKLPRLVTANLGARNQSNGHHPLHLHEGNRLSRNITGKRSDHHGTQFKAAIKQQTAKANDKDLHKSLVVAGKVHAPQPADSGIECGKKQHEHR